MTKITVRTVAFALAALSLFATNVVRADEPSPTPFQIEPAVSANSRTGDELVWTGDKGEVPSDHNPIRRTCREGEWIGVRGTADAPRHNGGQVAQSDVDGRRAEAAAPAAWQREWHWVEGVSISGRKAAQIWCLKPRDLRGPQGRPGRDGQDGVAGPQGETGPKGDQGDVGPQGPAGPMGPAAPIAPPSFEFGLGTGGAFSAPGSGLTPLRVSLGFRLSSIAWLQFRGGVGMADLGLKTRGLSAWGDGSLSIVARVKDRVEFGAGVAGLSHGTSGSREWLAGPTTALAVRLFSDMWLNAGVGVGFGRFFLAPSQTAISPTGYVGAEWRIIP